jgi:hypothetical protein
MRFWRLKHYNTKPANCGVSRCDFFDHFRPNYIFISFVYLTLDVMTVKNIIATLQKQHKNLGFIQFNTKNT